MVVVLYSSHASRQTLVVATGTVVEVDADTRRGRSLCRIRTRRADERTLLGELCRGRAQLNVLRYVDARIQYYAYVLLALTLPSTLLCAPDGRNAVSSGAPQTDASTQPALGDDDDPTTTVFHHTLRLRPDCDNPARFVRVNSRWAWGPGHRLLWALPLPSSYPPPSIGARHLSHRRPVLAFVYFDFSLRSTRRRTLRAMVSRFGLGTRTPVALGISPFLRLTLPRLRRFASRALTLTALHFIRLFFFSTWIRTGRIAA
ncbi:hypothetical protein R3P38DRAFT_3568933 [Favolaschia claudopus]|uniref:Uncharacterized protein n=1 Tax=Favolaschia claudopus TaxID=2862362 RepID=A0AAW0AUM4_9AGAR